MHKTYQRLHQAPATVLIATTVVIAVITLAMKIPIQLTSLPQKAELSYGLTEPEMALSEPLARPGRGVGVMRGARVEVA